MADAESPNSDAAVVEVEGVEMPGATAGQKGADSPLPAVKMPDVGVSPKKAQEGSSRFAG